MVNIAAPWGGAIKAIRLMTSGDNIDVGEKPFFTTNSTDVSFRFTLFHQFVFVLINVRLLQLHLLCPV